VLDELLSAKGHLFVVSGPSGVGKGTVIKGVLTRNRGARPLVKAVTCTTRSPRKGESMVAYQFLTRPEFAARIEAGYFLEHACYNGNYYGTPREEIESIRCSGTDVVLEIDIQGGLQVLKKVPEAVLVFVAPPSEDVLRERLVGRRTESPRAIEKRLRLAKREMRRARRYDYLIVNRTGRWGQAASELYRLIEAQRHRILPPHRIRP